MVKIPRLRYINDDEDDDTDPVPLGIRQLRKSGGSVVVTIPPEVLDFVDMNVGDDVVFHTTEESITLTKLPDE
jgi:hypothetical protein